jgi:hypothetical protein
MVVSTEGRDPLPAAGRNRQILWFAFLGATFFYAVLAAILGDDVWGGKRPAGDLSTLKYVLYAVGAAMFAGSLFLRRRLDSFSYPDAASAARGAVTAMVSGLALMEGVPILGLVLAVLGAGLGDSIPLLAAGIIGVLLQRPGSASLEERIKNQS